MGIDDLYQDYGIEIAPPGNKHAREGWVNTECPHCEGTFGYHLGFNKYYGYFFCWRCGAHNIDWTLSKLLNVNYGLAGEIAKKYRLSKGGTSTVEDLSSIRIGINPIKLPTDCVPLQKRHIKYLLKRKFDPDYLSRKWGLLGTGPASFLKSESEVVNYSHRVIFPINWGGEMVSFQARDITNKHATKYLACPMSREKVHHKHILYGPSILNRRSHSIIVEGAFDVWRLRSRTWATLGTGFTKKQLLLISKLSDKIFIVFDAEPTAQKRAQELATSLKWLGRNAIVFNELKTDPADLDQSEVSYFHRQLR